MNGVVLKTVAITGASGFVGKALTADLQASGTRVLKLVRREASSADEVTWSPQQGTVDVRKLEGVDAMVHLAGENVGAGRWTQEKKDRILKSRVDGTRTVAAALRQLQTPPKVFLSASGVGYYGNRRGEELLREDAAPAEDFLSQVCQAWEAEANKVSGLTRCVQVRIGMVLGKGGALDKMLPWFKLGLGGKIGTGDQFMSWIALEDLIRAIEHCLVTPQIYGPVNLVAPAAVRNADFTKALGRVLHRPAVLPVPSFGLKALYGEITDDMLGSQRAVPGVLQNTGFSYKYPELDGALRAAIG